MRREKARELVFLDIDKAVKNTSVKVFVNFLVFYKMEWKRYREFSTQQTILI